MPEGEDEVKNFNYAPWTDDEVTSLNDYQVSGFFHPFTCAQRSDSPHSDELGDTGILIATNRGWKCDDCGYTQEWAWNWMADGSWRESAEFQGKMFGQAHDFEKSPHTSISSWWCMKCSLDGYRPDTAELCDSIARWINSEFGGDKSGDPEVVARSIVKELVLPWFDKRVEVAIRTAVERGTIEP